MIPESYIPIYVDRMRASLADKAWFLPVVGTIGTIVDYGCADGALDAYIAEVEPNVQIVGYDNDPRMIEIARESHVGSGIKFTTKWPHNRGKYGKNNRGPRVLLLSSVIHEVYSYLPQHEIDSFWRDVWGSGYDYVVIRDMAVASDLQVCDVTYRERTAVKKAIDHRWISDFEDKWHSIEWDRKAFIHFLLKYRYVDNWARELNENYLPLSFEEYIRKVPANYQIVHAEHFTLPWIAKTVKNDLGIELRDKTHVKLIAKKKVWHHSFGDK